MTAILYDYWQSSAAYRVRIGLNLLGIDHDTVPVDLIAGEHREKANVSRNPQGLVPTLDIDGVTLTQSLAILEYINETRHAGWLPANPVERARMRALAYAIAMEIHPVCNSSVARYAVEQSGGALTIEEYMRHHMTRGLVAFERMLTGDGDYCHGDAPGLADICLAPQLYNARRWGIGLTGLPRIVKIGSNLVEIAAFADAHPDKHKPE